MDSVTTTRLPIRFAKLTLPNFGPVRYASLGRTSCWIRLTSAVAASCSPGGGVGDHHGRLAVPADHRRRHRRDPRRPLDRAAQRVTLQLPACPFATTISGASKPGPNPLRMAA